MNYSKQYKTIRMDDYTLYEGEIDRFGRPHGYGCTVKFNECIKDKSMRCNYFCYNIFKYLKKKALFNMIISISIFT